MFQSLLRLVMGPLVRRIAGTIVALAQGVRRCARAVAAMLAMGLLASAAQAHLMVAQQGTLNLVGDGGFMVLSLPVPALRGVDDEGDGLLSAAELQAHARDIAAQLTRGVCLIGAQGELPLQGLMLQLSPAGPVHDGAANQIVAMGRFDLQGQTEGLKLRRALFGSAEAEQTQQMTISHGSDVQSLWLTPERAEAVLLPGPWASFAHHASQGLSPVLGGPDHLLFLLLVLMSGLGARQLLLVLSCFTVGHALTLAATAAGLLAVPAGVVEPAIAATIVGLALYDCWSRQRALRGAATPSPAWRMALVFGCALIHGLGLAGALGDLGLSGSNRYWSLAGFNAGIELAQIGVALTVGASVWVLRQMQGPVAVLCATRMASVVAVVAGSAWLVQRVAGGA